MKRIFRPLSVLIPLFLLIACSNNTSEELAVVKVESNNLKNEMLEESLIENGEETAFEQMIIGDS